MKNVRTNIVLGGGEKLFRGKILLIEKMLSDSSQCLLTLLPDAQQRASNMFFCTCQLTLRLDISSRFLVFLEFYKNNIAISRTFRIFAKNHIVFKTSIYMLKSIIIGILAGYIASRIQKGKSSGCLGNLVLGIIGGVVGHLLFSFANFSIDNTFGELVSAVVGAIALLWLFSSRR